MQVERKLYSIKPIFIKKNNNYVLNICIGRVWKLYDKFMVTSGNGMHYNRCHFYFIHLNDLWVFSHDPILHFQWGKQILAGRTTVCGGRGEPCTAPEPRSTLRLSMSDTLWGYTESVGTLMSLMPIIYHTKPSLLFWPQGDEGWCATDGSGASCPHRVS